MTATQSTLDTHLFRRALGNFASGVTIVTACSADGQKVGVTANSFNSVSLDPPLILWSLDKRSSAWGVFEKASHFAVNLLSSEQISLSNHFARAQADKFAGIEHTPGLGGAPLLSSCAGNFQCVNYQQIDAGDHWIMLGKVEKFEDLSRSPLAYHQGGYAMVLPHPLAGGPDSGDTSGSSDLINSKLGNNLFYLMIQAVDATQQRFLRHRMNMGLHERESRLLIALDSVPNASLAELQQAVAMPAQEVTKAMLTMQQKGFLTLTGETRQVTPSGHAKMEEMLRIVAQSQQELFSELSEGELEVFRKGLRLAMVRD